MKKKTLLLLATFIWFCWTLQLHAQSKSSTYLGKAPELRATFNAIANSKLSKAKSAIGQIKQQLIGPSQMILNIDHSKRLGEADLFFGKVDNYDNSHFYLRLEGNEATGCIVLRDQKKYYKYSSTANGSVYLTEEDIDEILCVGYEESPDKGNASSELQIAAASVPILESLPGAEAVVLLDFDGQIVTNTLWNDIYNSGNPIVAAPSTLTESQIVEVWKMISEDYRPFALNITTSEEVFNKAPANRRMRVIYTSTSYFYPGVGGVAYIGSFTWGGTSSREAPCWAFNSGVKAAGEVGSHEVGHTLRLRHDGRTYPSETYYYGQNSWAPIMGVGYYRSVVQWSKGEYPSANNQEDDLGIITTYNGFTYKNDDHGNTNNTAKPMIIDERGNILPAANNGIITTSTDIDVFSFNTNGGATVLTVNPSSVHPNLDILLTLKNSSNEIVAMADPYTLGATISQQLQAGTYYLHIDGSAGALGANSDYASLGDYFISGTVSKNIIPYVNISSPSNGQNFSAPATINIAATASDEDGTVAKVEFFNGADKLGEDTSAPFTFSWKNVEAGNYTITAKVSDNYGLTSTASVPVTVNESYTQQVVSFSLIDASTKEVIQTLADGAILNLAMLPTTNLNIRANTSSGTVGSVVLALSGSQSQDAIESISPYDLFGDDGVWSPAVGNYTLKATPYSKSKGNGIAGTASSINFSVTNNTSNPNPPLVSNITTDNGKNYLLGELTLGALVYIDRIYEATSIPNFLNGAFLIQTANDDKRDASPNILSFELNQPATVYVAYDPRAIDLPSWLNGWLRLPDEVGINDSKISHMNIYSKSYSAGTVTLGGNMVSPAAGAKNNYFVMVNAEHSMMTSIVNAANTTHYNEDKSLKLKVYPNPSTSDKVYLELENFIKQEAVAIIVYDQLGRVVKSMNLVTDENGTAQAEVPVDKLKSRNVYLIRAEAASGKVQSKLIVE